MPDFRCASMKAASSLISTIVAPRSFMVAIAFSASALISGSPSKRSRRTPSFLPLSASQIERLGEIHTVFRGGIDLLDLAPHLNAPRVFRVREGENVHHEREVRHVPGHRTCAVKIQIFRRNARARYEPGRRAQADDARIGRGTTN